MKTDTSMNFMLVVFCAILLCFVFFSSKLSESLKIKQAQVEQIQIAR